MCRVSKHGNVSARSPVCIYCSKTNHGSAYCRYRPRDNCEEPRNTPDALKTGTVGINLALAARNQTGSTPHNNNKVPFSHSDGGGQSQPNGGQHRPQHRQQTGAAPRGQQLDTNPNFPPRRHNMLILIKVSTGDILPPYFLPLDSITQWPVMLLVDPSSS